MKLKEICKVSSGLVLSRKSAKESLSVDNGIKYETLTLKSLSPLGYIKKEDLDEFTAINPLQDRYFTKKGDIIMRMTEPYTAVLIDSETEGLVVTSNFIKICVKKEDYLPSYLLWYLGTPWTKKTFRLGSSSTMMGSISPSTIGNLEVKEIPLEKQEKLGELYKLFKKEEALQAEYATLNTLYHRLTLEQVYKQI